MSPNNVRFNGTEGRHIARNQVESVQGTVPKASSSSMPQAPSWPCPFKSWPKEVFMVSLSRDKCLPSFSLLTRKVTLPQAECTQQAVPLHTLPKASKSSCVTPAFFLFLIRTADEAVNSGYWQSIQEGRYLGGVWPVVTSAAEDSLAAQKWISGWKQSLGCGSFARTRLSTVGVCSVSFKLQSGTSEQRRGTEIRKWGRVHSAQVRGRQGSLGSGQSPAHSSVCSSGDILNVYGL